MHENAKERVIGRIYEQKKKNMKRKMKQILIVSEAPRGARG